MVTSFGRAASLRPSSSATHSSRGMAAKVPRCVAVGFVARGLRNKAITNAYHLLSNLDDVFSSTQS